MESRKCDASNLTMISREIGLSPDWASYQRIPCLDTIKASPAHHRSSFQDILFWQLILNSCLLVSQWPDLPIQPFESLHSLPRACSWGAIPIAIVHLGQVNYTKWLVTTKAMTHNWVINLRIRKERGDRPQPD